MAEPQRRGAKVVDAVLEATAAELARVGFAGLSFEDIAARAGVAKTTIYRRWPNKIALVRDALLTLSKHNVDDIDTGDVRSDLLEHVRRTAEGLRSPEGRSIATALLADEPSIRSLANELRAQGDAFMRALVERGMERKQLRHDIDVPLLLDLISGAVFQTFFLRHDRISDAHLQKLVEAAFAGAEAIGR